MIIQKKIKKQFKKKEGRVTPIRTALIEIMTKNQRPLSPQELLNYLIKKGLEANKTTVYRQLESLQKNQMVNEVHFNDRVTRYEILKQNTHHHHLVCLKCQKVDDISLPGDLKLQEKKVWRKNKFRVTQHFLEFFGYCKSCRK
jgi:Fur family ferric uptake transcriptional regulator